MAGKEQRRTTAGNVTRHDLQCVAPTRYSRGRCEGVALFLALLFFACSCAWGACTSGTFRCSYSSYNTCDGGCGAGENYISPCYVVRTTGISVDQYGGQHIEAGIFVNRPTSTTSQYNCSSGSLRGFISVGGINQCTGRISYEVCDTQAEADSVRCALDPTAAGCVQEQDTTLYYCKQEYSTTAQTWRAYIFKCSCKQTGGTITGCNGKQNVDVVDDCTPYKALNGDCSQNGYNNGVNADKDSTGTDVQCYAAVGADCIMRDRNSGNTFTCAGCDGSCDYAMRKIATGECRNPYPPPKETGDTLALPPDTSGYQPPPWSSSSESPPLSSFGEDLDALNGLYGVLDTIRDTLNGVAEDVRYIQANTQQANNYLAELVAKDWNPTINVAAPNLSVAGDTNIINVNVQGGDTSRAPAAILGLLSGALEGGQPQQGDTAGFGAREAGLLASIDSLLGEGVPDMSDSIGGAVQGERGAFDAFKDTLSNGAWNDSVSAWQNTLLNNGVLSGNGSDNCPAVLQRTWNVTLYGSAAMQFGPLGKYLCATLPFMGVTFWALARVILRAVVSILCMVWIFKAVMGIDGGSSEED